jgi:hypothetical protein
MDKIKFLKKCIIESMEEYSVYLNGSNLPSVKYSVIADDKNGKYQLLALGWEKNERIFSIIFHADIEGEHVWIQEDNTEEGLANLLIKRGIDKKDIVLAYYPESHRQYTEFAVA